MVNQDNEEFNQPNNAISMIDIMLDMPAWTPYQFMRFLGFAGISQPETVKTDIGHSSPKSPHAWLVWALDHGIELPENLLDWKEDWEDCHADKIPSPMPAPCQPMPNAKSRRSRDIIIYLLLKRLGLDPHDRHLASQLAEQSQLEGVWLTDETIRNTVRQAWKEVEKEKAEK